MTLTQSNKLQRPAVIGWDIGGAHVKAVALNANGDELFAIQEVCPLWKGLRYLDQAVNYIIQDYPETLQAKHHGVTMSGEMVDLFSNRVDGVNAIVDRIVGLLDTPKVKVYAGKLGFVSASKINGLELQIASANWLASAEYVAKKHGTGVLLDIGSTTTDIIPFKAGELVSKSLTDADRLRTGELVYTGVSRTPLMALGPVLVDDAGDVVNLAADVYRLTDDLPEDYDMDDTADGGDRSTESSARRIARMIGNDYEDASEGKWKALAGSFKAMQTDLILANLTKVADTHGLDAPAIYTVGLGSFLVESLAAKSEAKLDFKEISAEATDVCFPAFAVAKLWLEFKKNK